MLSGLEVALSGLKRWDSTKAWRDGALLSPHFLEGDVSVQPRKESEIWMCPTLAHGPLASVLQGELHHEGPRHLRPTKLVSAGGDGMCAVNKPHPRIPKYSHV